MIPGRGPLYRNSWPEARGSWKILRETGNASRRPPSPAEILLRPPPVVTTLCKIARRLVSSFSFHPLQPKLLEADRCCALLPIPTSDLDFNAKTGFHGVRHRLFLPRVSPRGRGLKEGVRTRRVFRRDCPSRSFLSLLSSLSSSSPFFSPSLSSMTRLPGSSSFPSSIQRLVFIAIYIFFFLSLTPGFVDSPSRCRVTAAGPSNFLPVMLVYIRALSLFLFSLRSFFFFTRFRGYSVNDHRGNLKITRPLRSKGIASKGITVEILSPSSSQWY